MQNPSGAPSRLHDTVETASALANVKLALVWVVGFAGLAVMLTPIGVRSSAITEIVPVSGGAPAAGGKGG